MGTCTPELFQNTDELMYALITNPIYMLPSNAPDGYYCPEEMDLNKIKKEGLLFILIPQNNPSTFFLIKRNIMIQSIDETISNNF